MRLVTRAGWRARPPTAQTSRSLAEVVGVCYHHDTGPQPSLLRPGASLVRHDQAYHMDARGYSDLAYNAMIGPGGKIYEGRSIHVLGAHSGGTYRGESANATLLGICFIGNYDTAELSEKAKQSALLLEYLWALKVGRRLEVVTHQETKATACPGGSVQRWVDGRRR